MRWQGSVALVEHLSQCRAQVEPTSLLRTAEFASLATMESSSVIVASAQKVLPGRSTSEQPACSSCWCGDCVVRCVRYRKTASKALLSQGAFQQAWSQYRLCLSVPRMLRAVSPQAVALEAFQQVLSCWEPGPVPEAPVAFSFCILLSSPG